MPHDLANPRTNAEYMIEVMMDRHRVCLCGPRCEGALTVNYASGALWQLGKRTRLNRSCSRWSRVKFRGRRCVID